jgi:hypothetical protein
MEDIIKKNEDIYQTIPNVSYQQTPQQEQTHEIAKKAVVETHVQTKVDTPVPQKIEKVVQVPKVEPAYNFTQSKPEVVHKQQAYPAVSTKTGNISTQKVSATPNKADPKVQTKSPEIKLPESKLKKT